MHIQSAGTDPASPFQNISPHRGRVSATTTAAISSAPAANSADKTTISQAARDLLAAQSKPATLTGSDATAVFETDHGPMTLNIDDYFTPAAHAGGAGFSLPPLLLPNRTNIDALSSHISAAFPGFLAESHIPYPPSSITYDNEGKVQLPPDYPYATEFRQALANNPTMARELSTVNALTSHLVEMRKSIPFQREYAAATPTEADAVVAKYSYLFSGNRHYDAIALHFSANGGLSLTADGKPVP